MPAADRGTGSRITSFGYSIRPLPCEPWQVPAQALPVFVQPGRVAPQPRVDTQR